MTSNIRSLAYRAAWVTEPKRDHAANGRCEVPLEIDDPEVALLNEAIDLQKDVP